MSDLFIDTPQKYLKNRTTAHTTNFGNGLSEDNDVDQKPDEGEEDIFSNILSLKLKKPKHWKWELSTSRSCMNIALPRIILYDHKGRLLVDTNDNQQEQVIREPVIKVSKKRSKPTSKNSLKSVTSNGSSCMRQVLENDFDNLCIAENYIDHTPSTIRSPVHSLTQSSVDFYTNDLADYQDKSRSNSCKEVRFNVGKDGKKSNGQASTISSCSINMVGLPTPPSTSTVSTTNTQTSTSNSSGPQPKRKYRRSRSSGLSSGPSSSILERFSFNRGRFSSPEYASEEKVQHAPRYYLATSKAGTLVVQKDSFSRYRRRCKIKHSSNENILSNESPTQIYNDQNVDSPIYLARDSFEIKQRKNYVARRHKSDGSVLLPKEISSSEEEDVPRARHKFKNIRKQNKKDVITIDPDNGILCAYELPTAR